MKTIRVIKFSLCLLMSFAALAQTSKTFKESFEVNKNADVFLNINNAEIVIETWNKNRVEVEATVSVDVEDEDLAKKILDDFNFEALGNSSKVEIKSGRRGAYTYRSFISSNGDVGIPREVIRNARPPKPQTPPIPPIPPMPNTVGEIELNFDMDKFNEEGKSYLIEFQDSIRAFFTDSDFKKEMVEWQKQFAEEWKKSGMQDSIKLYTYKLQNKLRPAMREVKKSLKPALQKMKQNMIHYEAGSKVKTKIIIKMPKDAKLDLDVKRSQLKIASIDNIKANLNYSGLQMSSLMGENNMVYATHSKVNIENVESLNLSLSYSKDAKLGKVNRLILNSKTSNVTIDEVVNQAIIEGSFGDLNISKISANFNLIDINLKNSNAILTLPTVKYNFYMNSKSSRLDLNNELDFKISQGYDTKIYQNSNQSNTNKSFNIKADFSTVILN